MQHQGVGDVWEHQAARGDDVTPGGATGGLVATGGRHNYSVYARVCVCVC